MKGNEGLTWGKPEWVGILKSSLWNSLNEPIPPQTHCSSRKLPNATLVQFLLSCLSNGLVPSRQFTGKSAEGIDSCKVQHLSHWGFHRCLPHQSHGGFKRLSIGWVANISETTDHSAVINYLVKVGIAWRFWKSLGRVELRCRPSSLCLSENWPRREPDSFRSPPVSI